MHGKLYREAALWIWEHQIGLPYRWGGDDPLAGFDCSGLVLEGLKGVGLFPRDGDSSAHDLANLHLSHKAVLEVDLAPGHLVFWGQPRITHVEIVWRRIGDFVLTIGASGGGSATTDREAAVRANAFVKIRPMRAGHVAAVDPFPSE